MIDTQMNDFETIAKKKTITTNVNNDKELSEGSFRNENLLNRINSGIYNVIA